MHPTRTKSGPDTLIFLRHGQTAESASGLFSGRQDVALTQYGERQAERWAETFAALNSKATAYTSPLQRAQRTAALAGFTDAQVLPSLFEWDLGKLEGKHSEDFRSQHREWSLFTDGAPGGESPATITERCNEALKTLLSSPSSITVAVSHGQFLRALTITALGLPLADARYLSFGPARAAILIRRSTGKLSLAGWNMLPNPGLLTDLT